MYKEQVKNYKISYVKAIHEKEKIVKERSALTCESSMVSDNQKFKSCRQRSVVYETWCNTCYKGDKGEKGEKEKENEVMKRGNEKNRKRERNEESSKGPLYRYIGETSRSTFE